MVEGALENKGICHLLDEELEISAKQHLKEIYRVNYTITA